MDLGLNTRCIFITWALLIIVCRTEGIGNAIASGCGSESENLSQDFTLYTYYHSHKVLFLAVLGTLSLTLLGCMSCCCCCCCCRWTTTEKVISLDAYAPRTQSIVWPTVPQETAHVIELTFLHTPGALDCLCSSCELAARMRHIENCLNSSEC